jgi:hypothetical protein
MASLLEFVHAQWQANFRHAEMADATTIVANET